MWGRRRAAVWHDTPMAPRFRTTTSRNPRISTQDLQPRLQAALGDTYRIQKELGGGGMSRVFLAEEPRLGRQVVVKVLPPEMSAAVNVERFEREIQLAARLQHPHVVPLLTAGASGDLLYYVMPFIAGESLRAKLGREGAMPVPEAVKILREVVDALAYAHKSGVVHRDIKPDNVLLSNGHAVVTDFGVAKAVTASSGHSSLTSLGVALGTPAYMAPEQAAADPHVDHRADIYAVGTLAYEMLTGRTPFTAPTPQALLAAHITQAPDPVTKHRPAVPAALNALLMRCLEKHPADRWQTAAELLAQLEVVLTPSGGMTPTAAVPAVSSGTAEALRQSHPLRVGVIFGVSALLTLGITWVVVQYFGLPDWVFYGAIALLVIGAPIIWVTGHFERARAHARATGTIVPPTTGGVHRYFTWKKAIRGGILAFAGLALVAGGYTAMRLLGIGPAGTLVASGRLAAKDPLLVADFENHTSDQGLGASVTEALRIDLSQSPVVRLLSTADVSGALQRMERDPNSPLTPDLAKEIAAREGAKAVVTGEINPVGRSYVLAVRLVSASDGSELLAIRENAADDAQILPAVDRLSKRVRERIGESLRSIRADAPLEQVTTSSLEALRLFSQGAKLSDLGNPTDAIPLLKQAIALDSGFAMAWRKLAVAMSNDFGSEAEIAAAATRAYQHRDRLPELERQYATAWYYDRVEVDPRRMEAAYRRVLELDPDNLIGLNNLSLKLSNQGQYAEAESLAARSVRTARGPSNDYLQLIFAQMGRGDTVAARKTLEALRRVDSTAPNTLLAELFIPAWSRDWPRMERAAARFGLSLRDPGAQSLVAGFRGHAATVQGKLAEGERQARIAMAADAERGLAGTALGDAATLALRYAIIRQDTAGARQVLAEALKQHPLATIPAADRPYGLLTTAYLHAGQPDQARRMLAEFASSVPEGVRRGRIDWYAANGFMALQEHRAQDAIQAFRDAETNAQCYLCAVRPLGLAYEQAGQPDSAIAAYERATGWHVGPAVMQDGLSLAPSFRRLGQLYEARGDTAKALDNYTKFLDLWREADPVLQPQIREVKERVAGLSGEPRR